MSSEPIKTCQQLGNFSNVVQERQKKKRSRDSARPLLRIGQSSNIKPTGTIARFLERVVRLPAKMNFVCHQINAIASLLSLTACLKSLKHEFDFFSERVQKNCCKKVRKTLADQCKEWLIQQRSCNWKGWVIKDKDPTSLKLVFKNRSHGLSYSLTGTYTAKKMPAGRLEIASCTLVGTFLPIYTWHFSTGRAIEGS